MRRQPTTPQRPLYPQISKRNQRKLLAYLQITTNTKVPQIKLNYNRIHQQNMISQTTIRLTNVTKLPSLLMGTRDEKALSVIGIGKQLVTNSLAAALTILYAFLTLIYVFFILHSSYGFYMYRVISIL